MVKAIEWVAPPSSLNSLSSSIETQELKTNIVAIKDRSFKRSRNLNCARMRAFTFPDSGSYVCPLWPNTTTLLDRPSSPVG